MQGFATGALPADVLVRNATPFVGEPCEDLHYYLVTLVEDAPGSTAVFAFAGGVVRGSLRLSDDQAHLIGAADAYVTDIQLGSYETIVENGGGSGLSCQINPTFHIYCPATRAMDQFCVKLVQRGRPGLPFSVQGLGADGVASGGRGAGDALR